MNVESIIRRSKVSTTSQVGFIAVLSEFENLVLGICVSSKREIFVYSRRINEYLYTLYIFGNIYNVFDLAE